MEGESLGNSCKAVSVVMGISFMEKGGHAEWRVRLDSKMELGC